MRSMCLLVASVVATASLLGLGVLPAPDAAWSPDPAASPGPRPGPGVWAPVDGVLGNAIPGLRIDSTPPIAWGGRLWTIELDVVAVPPGDRPQVTVWRDPALWRSSDGMTWTRRELPAGMTGDLSLMVWRHELTVIERRDRLGHLRYLVWRSPDGRRWHRAGGLSVRATGDRRGCTLAGEFEAVAGRQLVMATSCVLDRGAGGRVRPGLASVGLTASTGRRTYPTDTWTSRDARHWTRHRLLDGRTIHDDVEGLAAFRSVGRGVAAMTSGPGARLLWSLDGATFRGVAALPAGVPEDVDALLDDSGSPATWLLFMRELPVDAPLPIDAHGPPAVMRLDGDTWSSVRTLDVADAGAPSARGSIEVAGERVVVTIERSLLSTLVSTDGGTTWSESSDPPSTGYCDPRVAISGGVMVLGCDDEDGAEMRRGSLGTSVDGVT